MNRINMQNKSYSYFRSTLDHLWQANGKYVQQAINNSIELSSLTDVQKRYLCGFVDYINNMFNMNIKVDIDISNLHVDNIEFTEGAYELIYVLGNGKAKELIYKAIPEFKEYGLIITDVLRAK